MYAEGERLGHVVGGGRHLPVGMSQRQPGEPGANTGFVARAGAPSQQEVGQAGCLQRLGEHVAQRSVEVGDNNGNVVRCNAVVD